MTERLANEAPTGGGASNRVGRLRMRTFTATFNISLRWRVVADASALANSLDPADVGWGRSSRSGARAAESLGHRRAPRREELRLNTILRRSYDLLVHRLIILR